MKFKICYRNEVLHAAQHLAAQLNILGYEAQLVTGIDSTDSEHIYILYCAFVHEQLPPAYIVYQTEVPGSPWWNDNYYSILRNALAVWDYNATNIPAYAANVPGHLPVCAVTPGIWPREAVKKDIPILFYGRLNRLRHAFLHGITRQYKVTKVENVFGDEMSALLDRSRIVLNLHYYEQAPVESFRINEALSHGCHVISEPGPGMERYEGPVMFGETPQQFITHIYNAISQPFINNLQALDNLDELKTAVESIAIITNT